MWRREDDGTGRSRRFTYSIHYVSRLPPEGLIFGPQCRSASSCRTIRICIVRLAIVRVVVGLRYDHRY
jgi:hypothetical protein